jgi:hypothetical protein
MLEDRNKGPNKKGKAVEDMFIGSLEKALSVWNTLSGQQGRDAEMLAAAEAYRVEKAAEVVVYGHTHTPMLTDTLANCGCWCRDCDTFARIEDDGTVGLYEWRDNKAVPFNKELR